MSAAGCRIDIWLWQARFLRTRSLATAFVDRGGVRLTRHGRQSRLDRAARPVQVGDTLVFALNGRLVELTIAALGTRRGGSAEARGLYVPVDPTMPRG
ncbi:RNA-binding S4 domain-containing protein [uncultured Brevundimonas sp.]|uniref:RNA-binding S4 domain-containing protein n=1 Tax=uncultured Brevundimonas sp. TaxID=213418 RepID=UPI0030EE5BC1|tara:strand:+ start:490 stop:783 length:294 start_codon:yes stop_codon:yes gene_type:complete